MGNDREKRFPVVLCVLGGLLVVSLSIGIWNYAPGSSGHRDNESPTAGLGAGHVPKPERQLAPNTSAAPTKLGTSEPSNGSAHKDLHAVILPQVMAWEKEHAKVLRGLDIANQATASVMSVSLPPVDQKLKESVEQILASSGIASDMLEATRRGLLDDLGVSDKYRVIQFEIDETDADKDVALVLQTDGPGAVTIDPVSGNATIVSSGAGLFELKDNASRERFRHLFEVSE